MRTRVNEHQACALVWCLPTESIYAFLASQIIADTLDELKISLTKRVDLDESARKSLEAES